MAQWRVDSGSRWLGCGLVCGSRSRFFALENYPIAEQKIEERADGDGNQVREQVVHVELADERAHDEQVAGNRNGSVGGIELGESCERLEAMRGGTVLPGEALVPEEVVDDGG